MKIILTQLLICLSFGYLNQLFGQDTLSGDSGVTLVEQLPEYAGGQTALIKYLSENVNYPRYERRKKIEGTVYVKFVVDKTGKLKDVGLVEGTEFRSTEAMQKEAIRAVSNMPNWKPGIQQGKAVNCSYTIPIMFKFK